MKLATPNEMKILDQLAIDIYKIPGILLMENAALNIVSKAMEMLAAAPCGGKTVVVAGKGNNGGDAYATARHLIQKGYRVVVISLVERSRITGDAEKFLKILESIGASVIYAADEADIPKIKNLLYNSALIIDGIFGTGFYGSVTGIFKSVIEHINKSRAKVLSIDIPSGVNGETGQTGGIAVKADETVTFTLPKPGLFQYPGRIHAGNVTVADIGIPVAAIKQLKPDAELVDKAFFSEHIPERIADGHKNTFGRILAITGSKGMTGAGILTAKAAFKTGSGMVFLAVPDSLSSIYGMAIPEAITIPLKDTDGFITGENLNVLLEKSELMDTIVIGPGLSSNKQAILWVKTFVTNCKKPMVIDADALNIMAEEPDLLKTRSAATVITPHPGEFARLTGLSADEIRADRIGLALEFSRRWNVTVVLKGAGTVSATPTGEYYINSTGNPVLSVAGSGDVLAGIIGSLMGQGVKHDIASALGVYIHGMCGDILAAGCNRQAGFTAGEICDKIPFAMGGTNGRHFHEYKA
ncbi:MAG: NAD(P)H-hydrate dehydratase [Clostridiaceae bacterium]|nr:NAD(P)H-hydrate dehydratase [Clostridiaceae bacterium]